MRHPIVFASLLVFSVSCADDSNPMRNLQSADGSTAFLEASAAFEVAEPQLAEPKR